MSLTSSNKVFISSKKNWSGFIAGPLTFASLNIPRKRNASLAK